MLKEKRMTTVPPKEDAECIDFHKWLEARGVPHEHSRNEYRRHYAILHR